MKSSKSQWELAMVDMRLLVLQYAQDHSLSHFKQYNPATATDRSEAFEAGKITGAIEFLKWAEGQAKGMYQKQGSE